MEGPGPCHALAVNSDPIPFETPLFKGVVAVYIRHLPTTPLPLFKGKKRLAWVALQVWVGAGCGQGCSKQYSSLESSLGCSQVSNGLCRGLSLTTQHT